MNVLLHTPFRITLMLSFGLLYHSDVFSTLPLCCAALSSLTDQKVASRLIDKVFGLCFPQPNCSILFLLCSPNCVGFEALPYRSACFQQQCRGLLFERPFVFHWPKCHCLCDVCATFVVAASQSRISFLVPLGRPKSHHVFFLSLVACYFCSKSHYWDY